MNSASEIFTYLNDGSLECKNEQSNEPYFRKVLVFLYFYDGSLLY